MVRLRFRIPIYAPGLLQLPSFDVTNPNDTEKNIRAIRSDRPRESDDGDHRRWMG